MKNSLRNLNALVAHSLEPRTLITCQLDNDEFICWQKFMQEEGSELRLDLLDLLLGPAPEPEKKNLLAGVQSQLTLISDDISRYLIRDRKIWSTHAQALKIRSHYLFCLNFCEELQDFLAVRFPHLFNAHSKMTNFKIKRVIPDLRIHLGELVTALKGRNVSASLIDMVIKGLKSLLDRNHTLSGMRYVKLVKDKLMESMPADDSGLEFKLIALNFNLPEFYLHLVNDLDKRLLNINGLHEQLEFLAQRRIWLSGVESPSQNSLNPKFRDIKLELDCFLLERLQSVEKLMEIRRAAMQDKINAEDAFRILTELSVPQLALFVRVQLEVGLLLREHVTDVFNFVAQHFYTRNTLYISSGSLMKRSTEVEFSTALNLYDMLAKMMKWLDEKFSITNYQR